jgi:hypothetical protein
MLLKIDCSTRAGDTCRFCSLSIRDFHLSLLIKRQPPGVSSLSCRLSKFNAAALTFETSVSKSCHSNLLSGWIARLATTNFQPVLSSIQSTFIACLCITASTYQPCYKTTPSSAQHISLAPRLARNDYSACCIGFRGILCRSDERSRHRVANVGCGHSLNLQALYLVFSYSNGPCVSPRAIWQL